MITLDWVNKLDQRLIDIEQEIEQQLRNAEIENYKAKRAEYEATVKRRKTGEAEGDEYQFQHGDDSEDFEDFQIIHKKSAIPLATTNELDIPVTAADIKKLILQKKKEALIKKYASEATDEAKIEDTNMHINEM